MPKRCALGCPPLGVPSHIFPHPEKFPETFKTWVEIIGGKLETPDDYAFYRTKKLCDIHFTDKDRNRNHRLNALAVPTLCLPDHAVRNPLAAIENITGYPENVSAQGFDITQPSISKDQPSTSKENLKKLAPNANLDQPSTSMKNLPDPSVTYGSFATPILSALDAVETSTFRRNIPDAQSVLQEHSYSRQNKAHVRPTFPASKIRRSSATIYKTEVKSLERKVKRLQSKNKSFKDRLEKAETLNSDKDFIRVTRNMTSPAKLFTRMQFSETKKNPSGRRFTLEEKILSLSLYKRGAKVYKLLYKLFTLPSSKTLRCLLAKIKIGSGLVDVIFEKIEDTIQNMNTDDKLCTLMFDEMALSPQIHYDRASDKLKGFTDFENRKIADHVLVFMIKGVKANYKQPIAYYFTNSINKTQLKILIKEVVKKLQATGLRVLCTVCDQGTANVGAINELIQESKNKYFKKGRAWRHDFFEINGNKIIPLFDVPHIIKGMRNNLLNKDLTYTDLNDNNRQKIVKWEYFQQVYKADKCLGELKSLHKITEEHINPEKVRKMRVKNAAQIFSHSFAVVTSHLVARKYVSEECGQLVPVVLLLDNLFDSLNSSTFNIPDGKIYKAGVRRASPHHELWQNAIKTLKTMKFLIKKKKNGKVQLVESVTPTIKNFIRTIEGVQEIWKILSRQYSFDCLLTRHLNQDPLENFFGSIRSYGVRNVAPNCISFEGAYKSLLLNNFSSPHSIKANCEKDDFECLQNLQFFLNEKVIVSDAPEEDSINFSPDVLEAQIESDVGQGNYVCGWVLTKCLNKIVKGCKTCKENIIDKTDRKGNELIKRKEYHPNKKWLVYPSEQSEKAFKEIQNITVCTLKKDVPKKDLKRKIKDLVDTLIYFPFTCHIHGENLRHFFVDVTINVLIYSWCRTINRILGGKINYNGDDELKNIAQDFYNRHQHNKIKK